MTVSSKWGYAYTAGWQVDADPPEVKELTLAQFRRQWDESRALLGEHIDLYQIHSATIDSGVFDDGAVLAALAELRATAWRSACRPAAPTRPRRSTARASSTSSTPCSRRGTSRALRRAGAERAHASGMRVMIKEALANGRLTARGDTGFDDAHALAGVLARPWVDVVLSGAATVEQLRSNLRALEVGWTDELERRSEELVEDPAAYWEHRGDMAWT